MTGFDPRLVDARFAALTESEAATLARTIAGSPHLQRRQRELDALLALFDADVARAPEPRPGGWDRLAAALEPAGAAAGEGSSAVGAGLRVGARTPRPAGAATADDVRSTPISSPSSLRATDQSPPPLGGRVRVGGTQTATGSRATVAMPTGKPPGPDARAPAETIAQLASAAKALAGGRARPALSGSRRTTEPPAGVRDTASSSRPTWRRKWAWGVAGVGAAATVLSFVSIFLPRRTRPSDSATGPLAHVYDLPGGRPGLAAGAAVEDFLDLFARPGVPLRTGSTVSVSPRGRRLVRLSGGALLELGPGSRARFEGERRMHLEAGSATVEYQIAPDAGQNASAAPILATREATFFITGTRYTVVRKGDRSELAVHRGTVEVSAPERGSGGRLQQQVAAGQVLTVTASETRAPPRPAYEVTLAEWPASLALGAPGAAVFRVEPQSVACAPVPAWDAAAGPRRFQLRVEPDGALAYNVALPAPSRTEYDPRPAGRRRARLSFAPGVLFRAPGRYRVTAVFQPEGAPPVESAPRTIAVRP